MKKCNFCINEASCSFCWVSKDNVRFDNYACDVHWNIARNKQKNALDLDRLADGIETMVWKVNAGSYSGIVGSIGDGYNTDETK